MPQITAHINKTHRSLLDHSDLDTSAEDDIQVEEDGQDHEEDDDHETIEFHNNNELGEPMKVPTVGTIYFLACNTLLEPDPNLIGPHSSPCH
jgi:hypothetical protein